MMTEVLNRQPHLRYLTGPDTTVEAQITLTGDLTQGDSTHFSSEAAMAAAVVAASAEDEHILCANLGELGYAGISCVAFDNADRDRIGVCIASRGDEIIVVLRGTTGEEWFSNFDVGYGGEHRGFSKAADFAELRLSDYLFTHGIRVEPAFFITGYSRGGAVANILAKRLCDRYGIDRVRAYTLAAPHTTISKRAPRYGSIFNLVRDEDFFTRVPLAGWGYTKYGRTISLSDAGDVAARYRQLTGREYIGFTDAGSVDDFLCVAMTLAPNVHAYYERRRDVGGRMLSLYEFMTAVASMLAHDDGSYTDTLMSAMLSDYADMVSFLSSGADITSLLTSAAAVPHCSVADSHSTATYLAAMQEYPW